MGRTPNSTCCICGKNFYAKPHQIATNKWGLTCSRECCNEHKRRISHLCNPSNILKKRCEYCGKEYNTYDKNSKYCSHECYTKNKYKNKKVCGEAINDLQGEKLPNIKQLRYIWKNMVKRCVSKDYQEKHRCYKDVKICDEWLVFSNFYEWALLKYKDGFCLDKDILCGVGKKIYSPNTCCFIPPELNNSITSLRLNIKDENVGIYEKDGRYYPYLSIKNSKKNLGSYTNKNDAILARRKAKKDFVYKLAYKYKDVIEDKVFNALIDLFNY